MANLCPTTIHLCRVRHTRLNADGTVASAPNNHVVTASPMTLEITPDVLQGDSKDLIGGCDCLLATYRGKDKLRRWNLKLTMGDIEPAQIELMTGAGLLVNGVSENIGNTFPTSQLTCTGASQPPSALEAWSDLWIGDNQPQTGARYIRWIFPMTFWQPDAWTLQNDLGGFAFTGFTRTNPWNNPYIDFPTGVTAIPGQGGFFYDSTIPAAYCGYSTTST